MPDLPKSFVIPKSGDTINPQRPGAIVGGTPDARVSLPSDGGVMATQAYVSQVAGSGGSSDVIVTASLSENYSLNTASLQKVLSLTIPYSGAWLIEFNIISYYDYGTGDPTGLAGYGLIPGNVGSNFYFEDHASNQGMNYYKSSPTIDTTPQIPEIAAANTGSIYDSNDGFAIQQRPMIINTNVSDQVEIWLCSEVGGVPTEPSASAGASRVILKNSILKAKLLTRIEGVF